MTKGKLAFLFSFKCLKAVAKNARNLLLDSFFFLIVSAHMSSICVYVLIFLFYLCVFSV